MVKMTAEYQGHLHCELVHGPSASKLETDAPKDNQGKGERFSPTDLVGAALVSCILTTMAIVAERDGVSIQGARGEVQKEMIPQPRRIGALPVKIWLPASIAADYRKKLEHAAHACPVHKSLHPDIQAPIEFIYEEI
ncbi:MAG: OsmC family protein [Oligoflexia bacterium]|nr:OsmC family protein [Oligoflexia bacterium]